MRRMLRSNLFRAARTAPFAALLARLERARASDRTRLAVLTYHRVDDPHRRPDLDPALISATPAAFQQQVEYLREQCHVVPLQEVLRAAEGQADLPPRAVLITFDDAYRDFALHAWPAIRSAGLAVTLFVPTAFPGNPHRVFWWDRLNQALSRSDGLQSLDGMLPGGRMRSPEEAVRQAKRFLKSLPHDKAMTWIEQVAGKIGAPPADNDVLDWGSLRQLVQEGVTLAPHTHTHPLLTRISEDRIRAEVTRSFAELRREVGDRNVPAAFAAPSGAQDATVRRVLHECGVKVAFTTCRGVNRFGSCDPLALARINMARNTPFELVRLQLAL